MNEPVRRGLDLERPSKGDRRFDAACDQGDIRRLLAFREHTERDLRRVAVERAADDAPAGILDDDDVARGGACVGDVGAINPRMAAAESVLSARADDDTGSHSEAFSYQLSAIS